jgi:hypothetical protein
VCLDVWTEAPHSHPHRLSLSLSLSLCQARAAGVLVLAAGVAWREDGVAMWTGPMPIVL